MILTSFYSGEELDVLRTGCFKYFELGGECVNGPVSLLAGYVLLIYAVDEIANSLPIVLHRPPSSWRTTSSLLPFTRSGFSTHTQDQCKRHLGKNLFSGSPAFTSIPSYSLRAYELYVVMPSCPIMT